MLGTVAFPPGTDGTIYIFISVNQIIWYKLVI